LAQKVSLDELKSIANKIFELGANQLNANEKRIAQSYKNEIDELIWNLEFKYKNRKITVPDPVVLEKAKLKIAQKLLIHDQDDLSSEELEIYNANKKEIDSVKTQLIESINNKNKKNDQSVELNTEDKSQFTPGTPEISKEIKLKIKDKNYAEGPKSYQINEHVQISSSIINDTFNIDYIFQDHNTVSRNFQYSFDKKLVNILIEKFGFNKQIIEPFYYTNDSGYELHTKNMMTKLQNGLFILNDDSINVNHQSFINYYKKFAKPLSEYIINTLVSDDKDTEMDRIRFTMSFIQDISYGQPSFDHGDWMYNGVATPPEILLLGYGDCDSKTYLFISILSYLIDIDKVVIIITENHFLSAIANDSISNGQGIDIEGVRYYYTDTAGPGRVDIGEIELKKAIKQTIKVS